jgi:mRNA interferase MazF
MQEGDIILTPLPQVDGRIKNRPAIILRQMPPFGDFLVCGISTQLHQRVENFDEIIASEDDDFTSSGLLKESLIRLGFLAVLPSSQIVGSIGKVSSKRHRRLLQTLSRYLIYKPQ